jgi:MFS family permease
MLEWIRIVLGLLLIFFFPGFTLMRLLFPRADELDTEMGLLFQAVLGAVMSVVIAVLVGFVLGNPSLQGFTELNIWLFLGGLSLLFFVLGWYRGAYQFLGKLHPKLERPLPQTDIVEYNLGPLEDDTLLEFQKLTRERYQLRKDIKTFERKSRVQTKSMMEYYQRKSIKAQKRLSEIDKRIKDLEKLRARQLY